MSNMDGVRQVVAGEFVISFGRQGLVFRTLADGAPVHAFPFLEMPLECCPFADDGGPGVLTIESAGNLVRLWRPEGVRWRSMELTRPGLPVRRGVRGAVEVSAAGGEAVVRYADGVSLRFDTRSGARCDEAGPLPIGVPAPAGVE
ncbi:hypothetical protein ACIA8K_40705 [Catenuloplanes sp. NPDC051500]|uniref:hypothetical protein n=1 Tax=Catenuloplanes sp. NPDC051500 TaxID=3363959 RepID=UPI0037BE01E9